MKATRTCSVEGCDSAQKVMEWCQRHYQRFWKYGDPLGLAPKRGRAVCAVAGCGRLVHGRSFCQNHYMRWSRGYDPHIPPVLRGPDSPRWIPKSDLDYDAMHERIKEQRGKAREQRCITCSKRADEWAYRHTDAEPLIAENGCLYTDDVMAYEPMCRPCHRAYDFKVRRMLHEDGSVEHETIDA